MRDDDNHVADVEPPAKSNAATRELNEFQAKLAGLVTAASDDDRAAATAMVMKPEVTSVETISPTIAALIFTTANKHNRDFALTKASDYANQMGLGFWRLVHQGLAFYPNGTLADGQHRIGAVVISGTTQKFTVFRNFATDAMEAIDTAKRRTAGDAFGIIGLVQKSDAKIAGGVVLDVMQYEWLRTHARKIKPSIYEQKDYAQRHLDKLKAALAITHRVSVGDPVLTKVELGTIAMLMLLGGYAEPFVEEYLNDIVQSIGRYTGAPAVNLHDQFRRSKETSMAKSKLSREEKIALSIKGAALAHAKLSTGGLRWKVGKEPLPSPSPSPVKAAAAE